MAGSLEILTIESIKRLSFFTVHENDISPIEASPPLQLAIYASADNSIPSLRLIIRSLPPCILTLGAPT